MELLLGLAIGWTVARVFDGKYTFIEWQLVKKFWRYLVDIFFEKPNVWQVLAMILLYQIVLSVVKGWL